MPQKHDELQNDILMHIFTNIDSMHAGVEISFLLSNDPRGR